MPVNPNLGKFSTGNEKVEVLPYTFFNPSRHFSPTENIDILNTITRKWTLNSEQDRAFRVFASYASAPQAEPLKMYLGGMGGTGKSNVFKAILDFFVLRNEEYRFIVLGPTGSTAALLNGSTYHSVFKIPREGNSKNRNDIDGIPNDAANMALVNERLRGVEYILIDEVSMVSCNDLQVL
ncbi:hypothetical protein C8R45DRAFT_812440, partial [Mycena sanguinolenta]